MGLKGRYGQPHPGTRGHNDRVELVDYSSPTLPTQFISQPWDNHPPPCYRLDTHKGSVKARELSDRTHGLQSTDQSLQVGKGVISPSDLCVSRECGGQQTLVK